MRLLSFFNFFLICFYWRLAPRKTILANFFCFLLICLLKANITSADAEVCVYIALKLLDKS